MHNYVSTINSVAGALFVEASRFARHAQSVEVAAHPSTNDIVCSGDMLRGPCQFHEDSGVMFHISEGMFPVFQRELKIFK